MSVMPSPPSSFGLVHTGQATMHFPLTAPSLPVQINRRQIASISFLAHGGKLSAIMAYTGIADSTVFTQMSLSLLAMSVGRESEVDVWQPRPPSSGFRALAPSSLTMASQGT